MKLTPNEAQRQRNVWSISWNYKLLLNQIVTSALIVFEVFPIFDLYDREKASSQIFKNSSQTTWSPACLAWIYFGWSLYIPC